MVPFEFTDMQKRISLSILHKPKTAEELVKEFDLSYDEVMSELKALLKLKLISKAGYPLKNSLKKDIGEAVLRRKDVAEKDPFKIRLNIIIEAQAVEKTLLVKKMREIETALKKDKNYTVYDSSLEKPIKSGEHYTCYLELNLSVKDFPSMVNLMYFYGPSSVEVMKPEKLSMAAAELQDGLGIMCDMIQAYNHSILKLMTRQELDAFYKNLLAGKK